MRVIEYSKANTNGVRDLTDADSIVKACLELIRKLKPKHWVLENRRGCCAPGRSRCLTYST